MNNLQINPIVEGEYSITFQRFDEDLDIENGASYHGYNLLIKKDSTNFLAKKYDDDDFICFTGEQGEQTIQDVINIVKKNLDVKGYKVLTQEIVYL